MYLNGNEQYVTVQHLVGGAVLILDLGYSPFYGP